MKIRAYRSKALAKVLIHRLNAVCQCIDCMRQSNFLLQVFQLLVPMYIIVWTLMFVNVFILNWSLSRILYHQTLLRELRNAILISFYMQNFILQDSQNNIHKTNDFSLHHCFSQTFKYICTKCMDIFTRLNLIFINDDFYLYQQL